MLWVLLISCCVFISRPTRASTLVYLSNSSFPDRPLTKIMALLPNSQRINRLPATVPEGDVLFCIGSECPLIDRERLRALGSEAIAVEVSADTKTVSCDGNPLADDVFQMGGNRGELMGAYAALEMVGYAFFHPLEPVVPPGQILPLGEDRRSLYEAPTWSVRGMHYHTEHPLDLCDLLNGYNVSYVDEYEMYLQWLVANRQNRLEWVLLCSYGNETDLCTGPERTSRLQTLTQLAHDYLIGVLADVGISIKQQHAQHFVTKDHATLPEQVAAINAGLDWIVSCGFDGLSTENGMSEFTHGNCETSLAWLNATSRFQEKYPTKRTYVKEHCSTGQFCKEFKDPLTGGPLNFNFLPYEAPLTLGVMPHTVQFYSLLDPAPTYGNSNFTFMMDSAFYTAKTGRETIFFPETAYWVNYDINVPLFLPLYAWNRVFDMRLLAQQEQQRNVKLTGTFVFTSGWEWSYWFNDLVHARASWNPHAQLNDTEASFRALVAPLFTNAFGAADGSSLLNAIVKLCKMQKEGLIYGFKSPGSDIVKLNGQAYLQGWDTWATLGDIIGIANDQPQHLGLNEMRFNPFHHPKYLGQVQPLLNSLADSLSAIFQAWPTAGTTRSPYWQEFLDGINVTRARAAQVYHLYEYAHSRSNKSLALADQALLSGWQIVKRREANYRVPLSRVAAWGANPTAYGYRFLWSASSLIYWKRDRAIAMLDSLEDFSPCLYNVDNPAEIAIGGEFGIQNALSALRELLDKNKWGALFADCFAAPVEEPDFPPHFSPEL